MPGDGAENGTDIEERVPENLQRSVVGSHVHEHGVDCEKESEESGGAGEQVIRYTCFKFFMRTNVFSQYDGNNTMTFQILPVQYHSSIDQQPQQERI